MSNVALVPSFAPFSREDIAALNTIVSKSSREQRAWLSGFLAGLDAAANAAAQPAPAAPPRAKVPLTILYASESGNAEGLALAAKSAAAKQGFDARVHDMADVDLSVLTKAKNVLIYAATWGEGDPPQRAMAFYSALMDESAPRLDGLRYAVLGLGDSAYLNFCETAKRIDARLEALGAVRVVERADLDTDFARHAPDWTARTLAQFKPADAAPTGTIVHVDFGHGQLADVAEAPAFTAERPLEAEITALINLNGTGSTRETWHVELATDVAGFSYQPGDAIGIVPENDPELVARVLDVTGLSENAELADYLRTEADITTLSRPLIEKYAKLTGRSDVAALAADTNAFLAFASDRQLIDLLAAYPEKLSADQLKSLLRPLPPRLYSVASSPAAHLDETHLLIGAVRWQSHGIDRRGVASTFVADRRKPGDTLKIYVKPNRHFRLPEDSSQPIIMIGAGTGIAPFRSFVAERAAVGATGKSWLFFGERNFTYDFLYQLEWQEHLANGTLTRIDVAFSRDQPEKIYVQHRLWERRDEVRRWIADGAHIYVCGDEKKVGRDVDAMLARILSEPKGDDLEAGKAELTALAKAGRYQRDVY